MKKIALFMLLSFVVVALSGLVLAEKTSAKPCHIDSNCTYCIEQGCKTCKDCKSFKDCVNCKDCCDKSKPNKTEDCDSCQKTVK